jgi:bacteriocin biosynthesis cyclodehydratase domain-containing protein
MGFRMLVASADNFGQEMALRLGCPGHVALESIHRFVQLSIADTIARVGAGGRVVLASARPWPSLFERLSEQLRKAGLQGTYVYLEGSLLVVGPVVRASGGCWKCFARRELMHRGASGSCDADIAQRQFLDGNRAYEQLGYLAHVVDLGAAMVGVGLEEWGRWPSGLVRKVDLLTGIVTEATVVPLHGCSCRGERPEPTAGSRFVGSLQALALGA